MDLIIIKIKQTVNGNIKKQYQFKYCY
jgi:hypothetical protein